jgi:glycosyltransferase involved in cell wall biosynthesis
MTPMETEQESPVKLLMLSNYFVEHRGGIETVAAALARELGSFGFEVAWLAAGSPGNSATDSRTRRRSLAASSAAETLVKIPYPVLFLSAWRAIFEETRGADVVLVHDALYMTSVAAYLASRVYRKPLVIVQHIGVVPYRNTFLRGLMATANRLIAIPILRRADRVVFISLLTLQYFAKTHWLRAPALVFNGVDTTTFSPPANSAEIESARRSLGLPLGAPIVLFVGRFVEKKGLLILERIARARRDIIFAFAGWGALDPSNWKLPNVHVFASLCGASLAVLYRASDLLLLPSVGEGFPLVVQEALACGLPVICGLDTASADLSVTSFVKGVMVDMRDPDRTAGLFSKEMSRLLANPNTAAERFSRFEFARTHYSWADAVEQYRKILRELILPTCNDAGRLGIDFN